MPAVTPELAAPATRAPIPDFTPVPRKIVRRDGWTDVKQRTFIAALAETGSVTLACASVGMAAGGAYYLRNCEGGDSFARAWDAALDRGVDRVIDTLVDHAVNGTPETIWKDGELVAERRRFNHRSMMWLASHHRPERYGGPSGLAAHGGRSRAVLALEQQDRFRESQAEADRAGSLIERRLDRLRAAVLRECAPDPARRAAWNLLVGPTDWSRVPGYEDPDARTEFFDDTMQSNSTTVVLALPIDDDGTTIAQAMFGGEQEEDDAE